MVDSMANTAEDLLIDSFQFKIPPGASYVTDRRTISYFTAGSNIYQSGSGTKIIRINLTGDGWLDPTSIRLHLYFYFLYLFNKTYYKNYDNYVKKSPKSEKLIAFRQDFIY